MGTLLAMEIRKSDVVGDKGGKHRGINVLRIPHGTSLGEGPYVHGLFGPRRAWEVWIVLKTTVQLRKQVQRQVPGFPTHLPKSMGGAEGVGLLSCQMVDTRGRRQGSVTG